MCEQLSLWDTISAISSQGSEDGPTLYSSLTGQLASPSGLDLAPVSHLAWRAPEKEPQTFATSGPFFSGLLTSASLQQSLGNRLRQASEGIGSPVYALTWRVWDLLSGPPICALRASVRRISASDCTGAGWPTPISADASSVARHGYLGSSHSGTTLTDAARLAGWSTPVASDGAKSCNRFRPGKQNGLGAVASLVGWPTPTATDHKGGYKGGRIRDGKLCIGRLDLAAQIVEPKRLTADGQILTGSDAKTSAGGKLNPALSRWLMGYPIGWDDCGAMATRLYRK